MTQARESEVAGGGRRLPREADKALGLRVHPGAHSTPVRVTRQELHAANGKVAAWVSDGVLFKTVDGSKHFLRQPAGIAFDVAILDAARDLGALRVQVRDRETATTYTAALDAFTVHGVRLDRGCGAQVVLPFAYWRKLQPGAPVQLALL